MSHKTGRTVFFWILVCLFCITSATVLFVTFGYSFDRNRGIFVHTGSFTLKITPLEEATILIDGKKVTGRKLNILNNAFHIGGQTPGEHMIEISAPGYLSWKKKAIIESGKSTEFWNVSLIAEQYNRTSIENGDFNIRMFPSPKSNILALVSSKETTTNISTFDTESGEVEIITSIENAFFEESSEENLEWSTELDSVIIPLFLNGEKAYFLVNIEEKTTKNISEISEISNMQFARWDGKRKDTLYFLSEKSLYEWNISEEKNEKPALLASNVSGYDISQNSLYFLASDTGFIFRIKSGDTLEDAEQITEKSFSYSPESYALTIYDRYRIAIRERKSGALTIYNQGEKDIFQEIGTNVRGVQFSNDGKKLLYFTNREIFTYFVRAWNTQPARSENEIIQIARFSEPIAFVQWTKDYEHVLFSLGNIIKSIELDDRDRRIAETIASFEATPKQVFANFPTDGIFIIEHSGALLYFPFPENIETSNIKSPQQNIL